MVEKGYSVDWYATEEFKDIVNMSGANFIKYKVDFEEIHDLNNVTSNFYNLMNALLKLNRKCYKEYVDEINSDEISLVLYDSMCSFAKNITKKRNIKSVCLCSTLAYNFFTFIFSNMFISSIKLTIKHCFDLIKMIKVENKFRKENDIQRLKIIDLFMNKGDITIVLTLKELQPFVKSFPKSFKFVGTTIKDKICIRKQKYNDLYDIYISSGSIFTRNLVDETIYNKYFENKKVIINIGNLDVNSNNSNIEFVNYTDQLELLKNCKLFINHGGINSIYDSISNGVPQICIPQQEEQRMNAKIMAKKKIGYYMNKFDIDKISKNESKIKKYNKNIEFFKNLINNSDGAKNATNLIIKLLKQ